MKIDDVADNPSKSLFAANSTLCRALRKKEADLLSVQATLAELLKNDGAELKRRVRPVGTEPELLGVARGLEAALRAALLLANEKHTLFGRKESVSAVRAAVAAAIEQFSQAWPMTECPSDETPTVVQALLGQAGDDLVSQALRLGEPSSQMSPLGYWVVRDLLDHWVTERQSEGKLPAWKSATTAVVFANVGNLDGLVVWLTVELCDLSEKTPGAFCPAPCYLGLTAITNRGLPANNFHQTLQDAWTWSNLGKWYRGRWRISFARPDKPALATDDAYPAHLIGPSAQAAAFCALLAASGSPYRTDPSEKPAGTAEPIASDVAISATVRRAGADILQWPLGPVGGMASKFDSARKLLDTFIHAAYEQLSGEAKAIGKERTASWDKKCPEKSQVYRGLHIESCKTVGEALDLVLETNRILAAHQDEIRARWLCQWEGETGKARTDDKRDWTQADMIQAREKFTRHRAT